MRRFIWFKQVHFRYRWNRERTKLCTLGKHYPFNNPKSNKRHVGPAHSPQLWCGCVGGWVQSVSSVLSAPPHTQCYFQPGSALAAPTGETGSPFYRSTKDTSASEWEIYAGVCAAAYWYLTWSYILTRAGTADPKPQWVTKLKMQPTKLKRGCKCQIQSLDREV